MGKAPTQPPEFGDIEPTKPTGQKFPKSPPDREAFEAYMEEPIKSEKTEPGKQISPMELSSKTQIPPTPENLLTQVDSTNNIIGDIQGKLQTSKLKLKNSHQRLLDNKLSQSVNHLQKAADNLGAKKVNIPVSEDDRPIAKFLGYLSGGQQQLIEAKKKLQEMQAQGKKLSPSEMLLVQVNLSQAQQQIEFSSVLLSKVVDALKQTLNIQL